jgi:hypothetical protein
MSKVSATARTQLAGTGAAASSRPSWRELGPQRGGNRPLDVLEVLLELGDRDRAGDHRAHRLVPEGELQRRGGERHAVAQARRLEAPRALEQRRRRVGVVVLRSPALTLPARMPELNGPPITTDMPRDAA